MRIARLGDFRKEKPAVIINDHEAVFIDDLIGDWNRYELENDAFNKIKSLDLSNRSRVAISDFRVGSPIANPTKVICIGLNYAKHAQEAGATPSPEPVVFMKSPDTVVGGFDDVVIPPNSNSTDYEIELCAVIGKPALYLSSEHDVPDHILGYTISQDISERHWQLERSGQWMKGKSFPTFNPLGPWIVTEDEFSANGLNPNDLSLKCEISGEVRQDSRTSDLIFSINHCIWYLSQFMELNAGDIINTGTPEGVGMGFKPTKYLKGGERIDSHIEGIGSISSIVVKH
jgi:2-keto-4-pentenoate hydratase/2-oxohepta-3-ene-1,7-dioic acid hydratase in catechol pathway